MTYTNNTSTGPGQPMVYEIRIEGHLGPQWADWFAVLTITQEANGDTLLVGPLADQAALHGLLRKVRDLGLPLLSIMRLPRGDTPAPVIAQESGLLAAPGARPRA